MGPPSSRTILSPHASLPVCDETLDNLLGMVRLKDLLARGAEGQPTRFKGLLTLPDFIYEGTREIHMLMQADYLLGYREDRPTRCQLPPWDHETVDA